MLSPADHPILGRLALPLPPTLSVFPPHLSLGLLRRNAQPIDRCFGVHGRFFELPSIVVPLKVHHRNIQSSSKYPPPVSHLQYDGASGVAGIPSAQPIKTG